MKFHSAIAMLVAMSGSAAAWGQGSFPTVIGATGQPYGPTQAEYQYRLRYGRPSPGSNGNGMAYVNGYPGVGGGNFGYGGYNPFLYLNVGPYLTPPGAGYVYYPSTAYYGVYGNTNFGFPSPQPYLGQASPQMLLPLDPNLGGGLGNGSATITHFPTITNPVPIIQPSTPKAVETSFEFQTQGDLQLQQLNYMAASERYRKAIDTARDRADPRYRLAVSLAARSRFAEAADQLKLAGQLDPTWPQHATSLTQLFGERNTFEKTRVKQRVAEWTLQDARDPNRLLVLGAILYMDDDPNAKTLIETAILLEGQQSYLTTFLIPRTGQTEPAPAVPGNADQKPAANASQPPSPQLPAVGTPTAPRTTIPPAPKMTPPAAGLPRKPIPAIPPLPEAASGQPGQPTPPANSNATLEGPVLPPLP